MSVSSLVVEAPQAVLTSSIDQGAPPGYVVVQMGGPFVALNGPLWVAELGDSKRVGLRVQRKHCNVMGFCQGGMLATFADMMMPVSMYGRPEFVSRPSFLPTVSLQIDYIAPVFLNDWLEGTTEIIKITRSLVFAQGVVRVDGKPVLRCSGIYSVGPPIPPGSIGMYTDEMPDIAPVRS